MKTRVRAISYFLSLVAIAAIFFIVERFVEKYFFRNDDAVDIVSAMVAALSFSECRRFFDRATDAIFFRVPRDARAEFIANISHELQTPIAILRGNIERLQRGAITGAERVSAERVVLSTLDDMSRLIGGILESAKLRLPSAAALSEERIDMRSLLEEIHEGCLLLAEDKGVRFSIDVAVQSDTNMPVRGDRGKLKEVILNLISNALKYTPAGGAIALRASRIGSVARIVVEDTGAGIAPEHLPHIFERFYRIRNDPALGVADAPPGNGIGLNISRGIVEAHGGTILAESEPGKGSRFVVDLPLAPP